MSERGHCWDKEPHKYIKHGRQMDMEREVTGRGGSYVVHILIDVVLTKMGNFIRSVRHVERKGNRESCNERAGRRHRQNNSHSSTHTNLDVSSNVIKQAQA